MKFWGGQTVSAGGSAITLVALPLTAIGVLSAGPVEMGILSALADAPALFSPLAGALVDRVSRRRLLIFGDLGRAGLVALIPVSVLAGWLSFPLLYGIALGLGALFHLSELANTAIVPTIVPRDELMVANARLQGSRAALGIGGRGLAGVLVERFSAPAVLWLDAGSYLVSALSLVWMQDKERVEPARQGLWRNMGDGFRVVFNDPVLRTITVGTTIASFGGGAYQAAAVLFMSQTLGVGAAGIGLVLASGAAASVIAAPLTPWLTKRLGVGPAIIFAIVVDAIGTGLMPAATHTPIPLAVLVMGQMAFAGSLTVYSVVQLSVRQALAPNHLLGRVHAARRLLVFGVAPFGALLGGWLGTAVGVEGALWAATGILAGSAAVHLTSPIRRLRSLPPS